jgi:leader peptidase (prepilin peptidase) / N-methyltransferase
VAEMCVTAIFLLITVIDFEHRAVLSEVVLIGGLVIAVAGIRNNPAWTLPMLEGALAGFGCALALYLFGLLMAFVARWDLDAEPLGFGDVMIAGLLGLATGWPGVLMAMFLAVVLGGVAGIILLVWHRIRRQPAWDATMAYGPYLAIAALLFHYQGTGIANLFLR